MSLKEQQKQIDDAVTDMTFGERLFRAFGPLTGGILLDLLDLTTFGGLGLYLGPLLGALLGWWLAGSLKIGVWGQCGLILVSALYCALPSTEFIPVATMVFAVVRFFNYKS